MRDELESACHIAIGDGVEEIRLCCAPPSPNNSGYGVLANFFIPSFHIAREFIELPGKLVQIAADCRLKELDCGPTYRDSKFISGMVRDPFRASVTGQWIKLQLSGRGRKNRICFRPGC